MRLRFLLLTLVSCAFSLVAEAQLEVKDYHRDDYDPAATQFPVEYKAEQGMTKCALIIVKTPLKDVTFDGNVIQVSKKGGGYWVYVSQGTRLLEIIPAENDRLSSKEIDLTAAQDGDGVKLATYVLEVMPPAEWLKAQVPRSSFTLSAGFNATAIMGPVVSAGFMFSGFTVEAGAVYGLGKSKDVYIYDRAGELQDAYNYTPLRGFLRAGYDIWAAPVLAVTPQVGAAFTSVQGKRIGNLSLPAEKTLDGATAIAVTLSARLMFAPSGRTKPFRLFLTPEYDLAVQKDKNFDFLSQFDSKIKSWAEGLQLSLGLMFYF